MREADRRVNEGMASRTQGKMLFIMGGSGLWFRVVLK